MEKVVIDEKNANSSVFLLTKTLKIKNFALKTNFFEEFQKKHLTNPPPVYNRGMTN